MNARFCKRTILAMAGILMISAPAAAQDKNSSVAVAASRPQAAPVLTKSDVVTIYALTDGSRTPVSRKSFKGRFSLIVFGYTACPDVCPTSMTHVASVMEQLGPHADYVLPVFVTFDLVRDTAEVLADYVSHFDTRTIALAGTPQAIKAVQQAYGVLSIPGPKAEDGSYFISHSAAKYLIGPDGTHVQSFSHDDAPERITAYLKKIFSHMGM
jgi:protein SCO1/2